ncbi:oxidoreductase [Cellulomonas hominis]|jgi:D-threo-aldose 1-dehydrogenase|uniref:D-threo-aldose 1-dehydrogenase n=1 Tax=Cellulomonas hominis TaxID=156981 RepID=A0A511FCZ9_9CELL|nr:aldo/keto reductase [Cellulomonas hominis]MBB5475230.1 D-threo-aldose 1-dehydrogenase [Cellulomonas hominis]GEL47139.1 oxidoreductase [Cellulomonas hominis]
MAFRAALRPLTPAGAGPDAVPLASFGLGCAPIGNLYTPVAEADAEATVGRALERGIRFFDTAPHYGEGVSELRLGRALAGVDRGSVVIATKVGRTIVDADGVPAPPGGTGGPGGRTVGDLSRDGVLRSLEGSLIRLGTDRVDLLYLHDPADVDEALRGALPALLELRDQGVVRAVGVGMGRTAPVARLVRESAGVLDVVMPAGRLTLLDRTGLDDLLPAARARGTGVVAAGVYNSGVLADPVSAPYFDYRPASPDQVDRARRMAAACAAAGTDLPTAAVRYPLRLPGVEAVVVGARTPAEVDVAAAAASAHVPDRLWPELDAIAGAGAAAPVRP